MGDMLTGSRRALLGTLTLVAALITPTAHASVADWVVFDLVAGPSGAENITFSYSLSQTYGVGVPVLLGVGFALENSGSFVDVLPLGGGPLQLRTTSDVGAMDVSVVPADGPVGGAFAGNSTFSSLEPGQHVAEVVFLAGGSISNLYIQPVETGGGSVTVKSRVGSGSHALTAADVRDQGPAVALGPVAAGMETHTESVGRGLIGNFIGLNFCDPSCQSSWTSPDGRTGTNITAAPLPYRGTEVGSSFAGPAGTWSWSWMGSGISQSFCSITTDPSFGAYAPIGADWTLFAHETARTRISSGCILPS